MKEPGTVDRESIATGGEADGGGGWPPPPSLPRKRISVTPTPPGLRPPPPPKGRGQCVAILMESRILQSESGHHPFSRISPCSGPRGIAIGGGADGEGGCSPLPCLYRTKLLLKPHPRGAGAVRGDTWLKAVHDSSPASPHAVDRGSIAIGGGGPRGGGPSRYNERQPSVNRPGCPGCPG